MIVQGARGYGLNLSILTLLFGVWLPAAQAQGWSWTYAESTANRIDAHPATVSKTDARGFWAIGDSVLHYHPDATLDFANNRPNFGVGLATATLADGSLIYSPVPYPPQVVFGGEFPPTCSIYRLMPDGTPRWGVDLWWMFSCRKVAVDGHDVVWALDTNGTLASVAADGVTLIGSNGEAPVDFSRTLDFAVDRSAGNAYILTLDGSIAAYDDRGQLQWRWTDPNSAAAIDKIIFGSDGNLYAAGRTDRSTTGNALHIVSLTPTGQLRFVTDTAGTVNSVYAMSALSSGGFYLIDRQFDTVTTINVIFLQRLAADGSVLWSRPQPGFFDCNQYLPDCALTTTAENDALFAGRNIPVYTSWVMRYDSSGGLLHAISLGTGNLLASLTSRANGDTLLARAGDNYHPDLLEFDRHGNAQTPPVTTNVLADSALGVSYFAEDGSTYLAVGDSAGHSLAKIDRDGNVAWKTARIGEGFFSGQLSQAGNRVCDAAYHPLPAAHPWEVLYQMVLHCFAANDGSEVWSATIDTAATTAVGLPIRVLEDGSVVVLHFGSSLEQVLFDASGVELHRVVVADLIEPLFGLSIASNGTTVTMTGDWRLLAYDRNATKLYDISVPAQMRPTDSFFYPTVKVLADGSAVVTIDQNSGGAVTPFAWVVDPAGTTSWLSPLDDPHGLGNSSYSFTVSASEGGADRVYFTLRSLVDAEEHSVTVVARSRSNGQLLWKDTNVAIDWDEGVLVANPTGAGLVLLSPLVEKLSIAAIDPDTGAVRQRSEQACSDEVPLGGDVTFFQYGGCGFVSATLTADDMLRVSGGSASPTGPANSRLHALRNASAAPAPVRLDQPGVSGAWYPAYSGGQGFSIDYIASAHTLFVPWFTFAQTQSSPPPLLGVNDPSGLAWYGLQGNVSADARSVDLVIAVTDAGSFNSGTVSGHAVGTAHLSLNDCSNATLYYQFDAHKNGGAGGLISLTRLTPSTSPCVRADRTVTAAQNTNPPVQGFDARQSGSWFDPATAGQGLQMTIIPPGNGSSGLVFAAWFTFDPAGQSDDPIHQHWFTLQGDLSTATEGKVTLPIYRIIGGPFDGAPTQNFTQVGHATLTMQGCDSAQFQYQFDATEVAHAFAGLAGTSHLAKIGGCNAQ
ncbi:MAG TPA: hypothetical protein VLC97_16685 [Rhodanobacteraceae bacterium]|nr:hypothetical protein [Rhodanobacteraceae bacterium]